MAHSREELDYLDRLHDSLDDANDKVLVLQAALQDAILQLEYLHEKFGQTGSGNKVITDLRRVLEEM